MYKALPLQQLCRWRDLLPGCWISAQSQSQADGHSCCFSVYRFKQRQGRPCIPKTRTHRWHCHCHEEALPSTAPTHSTARTRVSADTQMPLCSSARQGWSLLVKSQPPSTHAIHMNIPDPSIISMASLSTTPAQIFSPLTHSTGLLLAIRSSLMCASTHTHWSHRHSTPYTLKYQHGPLPWDWLTLAKGRTPAAHPTPQQDREIK